MTFGQTVRKSTVVGTSGLFIGTSGYSYSEWIDAGFYPSGCHSSNMLPHYTRTFDTTELNYTWYQMPKPAALERMCTKVPEQFRIAVKLTRTMTHEVKKSEWTREAALFRQGISPLVTSGRLLAVLIQLPPYFNRSIAHRQYLAALLDELAGLPLAVEFRHASWAADTVFSELTRRGITLVCVDEPDLPGLFPRLARITNPDLFYLRFHGRNARGWGSGNMQQQFNYDYTDDELRGWADIIQSQILSRARSGAIFFNNHVRAQAPKNALRMMELLTKGTG